METSLSYEPVGFVQSSHVFQHFAVKIASLSGKLPQIKYHELLDNPDLFYSSLLGGDKEICIHVQCQLFDAKGNALSLAAHTPYKPFSSTKQFVWNSWLKLPIRYCDLPDDTKVVFTILDIGGPKDLEGGKKVIGTASTKLFRKTGCLKTGDYDLEVELAGGEAPSDKLKVTENEQVEQEDISESMGHFTDDEINITYPNPLHVRKSLKKFNREELEKSNDFLDRFAFAEANKFVYAENKKNDAMYLCVQFPKFSHPLMRNLTVEIKYCQLLENCFELNNQQAEVNEVRGRVFDPDLDMPNLVEEKHRRLMIVGRKGYHAELKPEKETKNKLMEILCKPLTEKLNEDERNLLWQYRSSLTAYPNALVKFLRSVEWENSEERKEAVHLMQYKWAVPRLQEVLELLAEEFATSLKLPCRQFAVAQLYKLPVGDLRLYLLQIVQSLRFENSDAISRKKRLATIDIGLGRPKFSQYERSDSNEDGGNESALSFYVQKERESLELAEAKAEHGRADLAEFLVKTASKHLSVALDLNWYLEAESQDEKTEDRVRDIFKTVKDYLEHYLRLLSETQRKLHSGEAEGEQGKEKGGVGSADRIGADKGKEVDAAEDIWETLQQQMGFVRLLTERMVQAKEKHKKREAREKLLKELLRQPVLEETTSGSASGPIEVFNFHCFPKPFPHPLDSSRMVYGVDIEGIRLFKSAMAPAKLAFFVDPRSARNAADRYQQKLNADMAVAAEEGSKKKQTALAPQSPLVPPYLSIYKVGDDVRQDQLIVQTIALMDDILKREHLDLRLNPYRVMATNMMLDSTKYVKCGFIEMIPSETVQDVLKNNKNSIKTWFQKIAPAPDGTVTSDGIDPEVMNTYVRSCAGYCVITYLLGVGDRHLENLMLTTKGHLFHIDFGFILDRDPKIFPPPMKLSQEMVEGMGFVGNVESEQYKEFKNFCYDAFQALRRSANLILSLFNLMIHSNITDICLEPDKTVKKIQDKFCLQMSDIDATQHLQSLINRSVGAFFPVLMDKFHYAAVEMN